MIDKPKLASRAKRAAKEAGTNWGAVAVFGIFVVTMCGMASSLADGSELKTAIIVGVLSFSTLFLGYFFTGRKQ